MEADEDRRKSSVEVEMENYLKEELGNGDPGSKTADEDHYAKPLDLTVTKVIISHLELGRNGN